MKCPHRIEPHQIQGLDFIHIYPVVQVNHLASFLNFAFALIIYVKGNKACLWKRLCELEYMYDN